MTSLLQFLRDTIKKIRLFQTGNAQTVYRFYHKHLFKMFYDELFVIILANSRFISIFNSSLDFDLAGSGIFVLVNDSVELPQTLQSHNEYTLFVFVFND